jgi:hypothetical protein
VAHDVEAERQRLEARYSQMSEGELEKLAAESSELTPESREVLRGVIAQRALAIDVPEPFYEYDDVELRPLVTLRRFRDLPEALAAKGALDSAGIECTLADDNIVRMDWFFSNLMGGVKLQVAPEDVDAALALLDEPPPSSVEVQGEGEVELPRCPKCGSMDIAFQALNEPVAYSTMFIGVPIPAHYKGWYCSNCKHKWDDAPAE